MHHPAVVPAVHGVCVPRPLAGTGNQDGTEPCSRCIFSVLTGGAKVGLQLWVYECIFVLLFINYCIIFCGTNCKPTLASPCTYLFPHRKYLRLLCVISELPASLLPALVGRGVIKGNKAYPNTGSVNTGAAIAACQSDDWAGHYVTKGRVAYVAWRCWTRGRSLSGQMEWMSEISSH